MSETRSFTIPAEIVEKLLFISKKFKKLNTGNKSRDFWMVNDQDQQSGGSYEWDQFDMGINDSGELITCCQGGCSCNSPEPPSEDTGDKERLKLKGKLKVPYESSYNDKFKTKEFFGMVRTLYNIFKTGRFSASSILSIGNAEIRRAVIEYVGLEKFLKKARPKTIDKSRFGKLVKIKVPEPDEDIVAVFVKDASTPREYFLRVPPTMKTAKQAVAWTFGLEETEYSPTEEA